MEPIFFIPLLFFGLLIAHECFRRSAHVKFLFFIAVPLFAFPIWMHANITVAFFWVKIISLLAGIYWIFLLQHTKLVKKRWALWITAALLALNILEGSLTQFLQFETLSILHAFAGVLLVLLIPHPKGIYIDTKKGMNDFCWRGFSWNWIIAYSFWILTFVYMLVDGGFFTSFAILSAAIVLSYHKKERWLQARAYTLSAAYIFGFTFYAFFVRSTTVVVDYHFVPHLLIFSTFILLGREALSRMKRKKARK